MPFFFLILAVAKFTAGLNCSWFSFVHEQCCVCNQGYDWKFQPWSNVRLLLEKKKQKKTPGLWTLFVLHLLNVQTFNSWPQKEIAHCNTRSIELFKLSLLCCFVANYFCLTLIDPIGHPFPQIMHIYSFVSAAGRCDSSVCIHTVHLAWQSYPWLGTFSNTLLRTLDS